ncbi:MAG TPA: ARMT1-like domain-containing protein [Candidatus Hydrogenedentes bacterium]|nr:ARMT1-like domain-containing protein [Candidatus Hydrogenedentota bacterium]HPU96847.1 ARMT1-like domain-containing protein [Candidatus Hydrogenedentota bacterium]
MRVQPECLVCMMQQTLRVARMSSDDVRVHWESLREVGGGIAGMDPGKSPAVLSLALYETVRRLSGVRDPYAEAKRAQNETALAIEDELRAMVRSADDPLDMALRLAAAGNVIDLGVLRAEHIDIREAVDRALSGGFAVDETQAFRERLAQSRDMLYLLDNAGEIVFDKILIELLCRDRSVTAVVKAGPIINDACMEDARMVGLDRVCPVIDCGGAYVGCPLDLIPTSFRDRLDRAGLVLAKGQGHYETLDAYDGPAAVFVMLKAKCGVVARHAGVKAGDLIFKRCNAAPAGQNVPAQLS